MTEKNWKSIALETEIVSGHCPECTMYTILVGLHRTFFRCTNCGFDVEQKINGVIKYMKVDKDSKMKLTDLDNGQKI
jgi:transposase-like protein